MQVKASFGSLAVILLGLETEAVSGCGWWYDFYSWWVQRVETLRFESQICQGLGSALGLLERGRVILGSDRVLGCLGGIDALERGIF